MKYECILMTSFDSRDIEADSPEEARKRFAEYIRWNVSENVVIAIDSDGDEYREEDKP